MSTETLSEEQRARIQANRERALALRVQKQQQSSVASTVPAPANFQRSNTSSPAKSFPANSDGQSSNSSSFTNLKISTASSTPNFTALKPSYSSPSKFARSATHPSSSSNFSPNKTGSFPSSVGGLKSKYWSKDGAGTDRDSKGAIKFGMKRTEIKCVLVANYRFMAECSYHKEAIEIFRSVQGATYNPSTKTWSFPLSSYREFDQKIRQLTTIGLSPLPSHITGVFSKYIQGSATSSSNQEFDLDLINDSLLSRLFPFQRECINFAVSRGGRVLIADDMGLGKTIEALGILDYYRDDWPVLIVCPASLKYTWKQAILDWLPSVKEEEIVVIDKGPDVALMGQKSMRITIASYHGEVLKNNMEERFKMIVLDESHSIKNPDTQRTKACERILKGSKRVILLSGTPALSRPRELFTQIKAVDPKLFRSFTQFGTRYCDPKTVKIKRNQTAVDYNGASNMEELEALLKETIMIRRIKEDVLNQLPAKIRGMVLLDSQLIKISEKEKKKATRINDDRLNSAERRSAMLEFFNVTAEAKLRAVTDYVLELLEQNKKFLLFAHHRVMLDHLQTRIAQTPHETIRIDGQTPAAERKRLCDRFQTDETVRVALLSITATNTGLTLTAANLVVFAELFWNPGVLAQAEDRAHRVGQSDCVQVQYLVARGTVDDLMWPLIQKKLDILNKGGLSKGAFQTSETTHAESTNGKATQSSITDFMESICDEDLLLAADILEGEMLASPSKKPRLETQ